MKNFNKEFERIFKKHHSEKIDVFLDRDGKNHYPLFKKELEKYFDCSLLKSIKNVRERKFNLGERKWCKICCKRIMSELRVTLIKNVKRN